MNLYAVFHFDPLEEQNKQIFIKIFYNLEESKKFVKNISNENKWSSKNYIIREFKLNSSIYYLEGREITE